MYVYVCGRSRNRSWAQLSPTELRDKNGSSNFYFISNKRYQLVMVNFFIWAHHELSTHALIKNMFWMDSVKLVTKTWKGRKWHYVTNNITKYLHDTNYVSYKTVGIIISKQYTIEMLFLQEVYFELLGRLISQIIIIQI